MHASQEYEVLTYEEAVERYISERTDPTWQPLRLGFGSIDHEIRGLAHGQIMGICARTAVGKTWLLATIEHNLGGMEQVGQLALSLEMPASEWVERAIAIEDGISPFEVERRVRRKEVTEASPAFCARRRNSLLCEQAVRLEHLPQVLALARDCVRVPLRVVLIDYLGLLGTQGADAYERMSRVARGLKRIVKDEKISVIVAMQLSRSGGDGTQEVSREQIRDSGVIEESCDFILGCWRHKDPDSQTGELDNRLSVAILKNRRGREGRVVNLEFQQESRRVFEPVI